MKYSSVKTMVISQASGIWIEFVSATSFFITLIFLILPTTNFTKKFSNWNAIQAAFGFIMAIFYFTCGLDLLIKGINFERLVTKCLFPEKWWILTFGTSYVSFFGSIVYGLYGLLALRRMMKWCWIVWPGLRNFIERQSKFNAFFQSNEHPKTIGLYRVKQFDAELKK